MKGVLAMKTTKIATLLKTVAGSAIKSSKHTANTACIVWQYQPKNTDKLKKLRKF